MDFNDILIKCATCGREFIFTAREQEFFSSKGFKEPRHCRECRQLRKQDRGKGTEVVSPSSVQAPKNAYQVVCAQCQRETFVPFRPITGKPVLCKDCFIAQRYGSAPKPAGDAAIMDPSKLIADETKDAQPTQESPPKSNGMTSPQSDQESLAGEPSNADNSSAISPETESGA